MLIEVEGASGATAGAAVTHALVVGVSHYPFLDGPAATPQGEQLGMANLSTAARSASEVAAWLLEEYHQPDAPLASLRLLLSPVEGEPLHETVAGRMGGTPTPATRDELKKAFTAFREACRSNPANRAFVFFAGHGIQLNKHGAIVLLEDFATADEDDLLYGAVDVLGCWGSMNETGGADNQVWFSDACRQRPEIAKRFESLSGAFAPGNQGLGNVAASPLFLSSSTREQAFADPTSLTIFTQALLWALRGAAAAGADESCPEWHVSSTRLSEVLPRRVVALLAGTASDQSVEVTGRANPVVVQRFAETPQVDIEVVVTPEGLVPAPTANLLLEGVQPVEVEASWPLRVRSAAGLYQLTVEAAGELPRRGQKLFKAEPPTCTTTVEVSAP